MISNMTTISKTTAAVRILLIRSILLTVFSRLLSIYFRPLLQSCSLGPLGEPKVNYQDNDKYSNS